MSRHRFVRNLSKDDYDDFYDDADTPADEHDERLDAAFESVKEIVGDTVDDHEIEESLYYYNMDVEKTVRWLLDGVDADELGEQASQPEASKQAKPKQASKPKEESKEEAKTTTKSSLLGSKLSSLLAAAPSSSGGQSQTLSGLLAAKPTQPLLSMTGSATPLMLGRKPNSGSNNLLSTALSALQAPKVPLTATSKPFSLTGLLSSGPAPLSSAVLPTKKQTLPVLPEPAVTHQPAPLPSLPSQELAPPSLLKQPSDSARLLSRRPRQPAMQQDLLSKLGFSDYLHFLSAATKVQPFTFDKPSPDDVVAQAQSRSAKGKASTSAKPAKQPDNARPKQSAVKQDIVRGQSANDINQLSFDVSALGLTADRPEAVAEIKRAAAQRSAASTRESSPAPPSRQPSSAESSTQGTSRRAGAGKKVNIREEYDKRRQAKDSLNLVVVGMCLCFLCLYPSPLLTVFVTIGHVDAGKSTLMGHMLFKLGHVNDKTMKKYERDSQKQGKGSFAYAWVLDETAEERERYRITPNPCFLLMLITVRGITIDIAVSRFETEKRQFTLLDAPGHRDFIPNMISGAAQADVAILVVDATVGEFEAGFDHNGQTKEHALLVRSLGIGQIVVAVNKLDGMGWSQTRFDEIAAKLTPFLLSAGFRKNKIYFVPTSGLTGENLVTRSEAALAAWYTGPTLAQQMDVLEIPERPIDRPFRLSITDFYKGGAQGGAVSVSGRIESGSVQVGDAVLLMPVGEQGTVRAIESNEQSEKWAVAGDQVTLSLAALDPMQFSIGNILCSPAHPIPVTSMIRAKIVVFDVKVPVTLGFPVIFHHQSLTETANITKLLELLDKSTGEVSKRTPRCITRGQSAHVEITLGKPICLDTFETSKELGRFMLRKGGETVAAGVTTEILTYHQPNSVAGRSE
ncbi:hypothetical protein RI367_004992 [Sorochytrium milnesiophthora]